MIHLAFDFKTLYCFFDYLIRHLKTVIKNYSKVFLYGSNLFYGFEEENKI